MGQIQDADERLIKSRQYNIGHICTTQQCSAGMADKTAMRWIDQRGCRSEFTFEALDAQSNRFANLFLSLGLKRGDVVFLFLPKMPVQFFAFLGALKARLICGTLFANFGEEALLDRLGDSRAKAVLTTRSLLKRTLNIRPELPALKHILVADGCVPAASGTLNLKELLDVASGDFDTPLTGANTPSVLHYTSGSTGKPKGVLHRHGSVLGQHGTTREILGLRPDDIFWCTADQGWITGTSYGIIGPWSLGVTQVHYGGGYDAKKWMALIEAEKVSVWYSAPTALRMLMREDEKIFRAADLSRLRHIFSVGEPLNPEVIHWSRRLLKREVYDTWFQTETGAIMIANRPGLPVRPGSMGKPAAGVEPAILADNGAQLPDGAHGGLCLRPGWPSMFTAYLGHDDIYRRKFKRGWYHTGDTARRDRDGYYWFMGRSDDVINTAGHLISPFEIESALLEMEEVAESAAIGAPDGLLFEKVVVFVKLRGGLVRSPELELKIRLHVSNRVSSIATPRSVVFRDSIPKNKGGKIMRRLLKAEYTGSAAGDMSTLEA